MRESRTDAGRGRQEAQAALKAAQDNLPIPGERETVGAFLDNWLRESAAPALRPRTLASYRMIVEKHLVPELGKVVLARLTPDMVQKYMNGKRAASLSPRSVQYHHAVLRRALGQALRWGKVSRNVAQFISPPKVERAETRPLMPEQARVLLRGITEDRHAALYALALGLGLRQGELLGLGWGDVDFEAETLTVRHTLQRYGREYHLDPPKTDKIRRTIALSSTLVQLLRAHRAQQLQDPLARGTGVAGRRMELGLLYRSRTPVLRLPLDAQVSGASSVVGAPAPALPRPSPRRRDVHARPGR